MLRFRIDQAADNLRSGARPEVDALTKSYRAELAATLSRGSR